VQNLQLSATRWGAPLQAIVQSRTPSRVAVHATRMAYEAALPGALLGLLLQGHVPALSMCNVFDAQYSRRRVQCMRSALTHELGLLVLQRLGGLLQLGCRLGVALKANNVMATYGWSKSSDRQV
jgi:hypothetical protein